MYNAKSLYKHPLLVLICHKRKELLEKCLKLNFSVSLPLHYIAWKLTSFSIAQVWAIQRVNWLIFPMRRRDFDFAGRMLAPFSFTLFFSFFLIFMKGLRFWDCLYMYIWSLQTFSFLLSVCTRVCKYRKIVKNMRVC